MYAQLEEDYGLAKRSMAILERATQAVADEDKFEVGILNVWFFSKIYLPCSPDVHRLHRESHGKLWSSSYTVNIRKGYRR